jgi:hypothetical protein
MGAFMNEIFRFMTIRSAQLADPVIAIDLSTYMSRQAAAVPARGRVAQKRAVQQPALNQPKGAARYASAFGTRKAPAALHFASIYESIRTQITPPGFSATRVGAVVRLAVGKKPLSSWVAAANYVADKNDAAIALIAAHLRPTGDRSIETLAAYVRIMHLIDDLAGGASINNPATLRYYQNALIITPPGVFPLIEVGPPYNPFVVPAGVTDLQVVKQELLGYEKKEVSYIANVLLSETNKRVTVRFEKTDQTTTKTTDTTTQTEQDTQSSERFQVQTQAQKTIQDDSNLKFGLTVSASYGPSINAKSNFDYGSSQATTDSNSVSNSYAKEITSRSVSKVTQEVIEQQRVDIINSFREKIIHGFDNTQGTDNVSGVYQYVDALYEVGVFNYGTRLLLDLVVPDPAAFIRDAIRVANSGDASAYNPPPITFQPSDLTVPKVLLPVLPAGPNVGQPNNDYPAIAQWRDPDPSSGSRGSFDYTIQARIYQVQGLKAPGDPAVTVAKSYSGTSTTTTGAGSLPMVSDTFTIPAGYQAQSATVVVSLQSMPESLPNAPAYDSNSTYAAEAEVIYNGKGYVSLQSANSGNQPDTSPIWWAESWAYNLAVNVGNKFLQWGNRVWAGTLPNGVPSDTGFVGSGVALTVDGLNERGTIGVTISGGVVLAYVANVEVKCVMTDETFAQWQLNTFTTINQSYLSLLSTYQEATSQTQQGLSGGSYPGNSPDENLRVVQTELKREVISLVTLQQFDPPTSAAGYAAATTYEAGAIVAYNNVAYVSLHGGNQGNQPNINPGWWSTSITQFNAPRVATPFVPATSYAIGAIVSYNGQLYFSLQDNNNNNQPDVSPTWWATDIATYVDPNLPPPSAQGNSVTASAINIPVLFAEAPIIRFMEEAFEWEQMQYVFYPYYWNSKNKWFGLALLEDSHALFAQFLRAGASRVVVPVRPGFERAFIYFLQTGQPWDGGSPPQVYDPLYLSLAAEIEAADQRPITETLIEPTWTMQLPTTLTMLRTNTPNFPPYVPTASYIIGSVVTSSGIVYRASQTPYEPGQTYSSGAVVSYADVSYVSDQAAYSSVSTYGISDVVILNGFTYTSLQSGNTGNQPDTSPTWWAATPNIGNEPDTNPQWWLGTPNVGHDPSANPAWWTPSDSSLPSWTLDSYMNVVASN